MADGISFPDYYAQANDRAMAAQKLAQAQALTQGIQLENAQAQKTAQRADQFMAAMQQQQQQNPNASWHDRIASTISASIASGDYADADKQIGIFSKAAEQESKALEAGQKAVSEDIANKQKKFAQQASFLSGVSSQADLDARRAAYKQAYGEDLPFQQFTPGMDKRFEDISISALDRAKIISEQMKAKTDQIRANAEAQRAQAEVELDKHRGAAEDARAERDRKEGAKFAAQAANGGGSGAGAGGAINFRYNNAQTGASNEVATEIENWQKLDPTGVSSAFTGIMKPGSSTSDATRAFMARKLTPTETQVLGTTFGGMAKSIATMSSQGRPVTAPVLAAIEKSIIPVQGDDGATVMAKGARMRQYMENNIRDLKMSGATPAQLEQAQENLEKAQKYLPTWDQVIAATPTNKRAALQRQAKAADEAVEKEKAAAPVSISSDQEFDALPSGAEFIAPDGSHRRKP